MNEDVLREFTEQLGVDEDVIEDRWQGRPDLIAEDIFQIQDIDSGEVRDLELFPSQKKAMHAYFYGDAHKISNYKGRRIGYSFIYCVSFLLEGMFIPNSFYPFVARKYGQAENRIGDISKLINHAKVDIPVEKDNNGEIVLWNGTTFEAFSANPDAERGDDPARAVMLDEMAFMEDQQAVSRAFGAFLSLGSDRKMVQVSTPNVANDLFMQTHRRGTATGYDENGEKVGVISIKQPSFYNAEQIDINRSLFEQDVTPVRPDMNIGQVEEERAADPKGFAQEYLCQPIVDEYRFFSVSSIKESMERGGKAKYLTGLQAPNSADLRVLGVDIGISHDDTVIQVFDHIEDRRLHRYQEIITDDVLLHEGFSNPDRGNARQVVTRIATVFREMNADLVVMDRTGPGETFDREATEKLGRAVVGFNFSDKRKVEEMMGDMNNALRNGRVSLIPDDRLKDELSSIIKEKKEDWSVPKFSGKDNSETGKDDTAMAAVLAAFPPGYAVTPGREADQRTTATPADPEGNPTPDPVPTPTPKEAASTAGANFGSTTVSRRGHGHRSQTNYNSRHSRR
jgi:phage FluMu gp28-like protein